MTEENILSVQKMLSDAGSIIDKYEDLAYETGSKFNIFEIANIGADERIVCRVLHEILSPSGSHGQGGAYLEMFLRDCVGVELSKDEINKADVRREHPANGRYIDITIKTGKRFIPIEVKVWADDQERQCFDYYQFARKIDETTQVIYLTPFGHTPPEHSAKGLTKNDDGYKEVKQISFSAEIIKWLKECLSLSGTIRTAPIREIIMQFISAIEIFTGKMEDKPMEEMKKLLFDSSENLKNAISIYNVLNIEFKSFNENYFKLFDPIMFDNIVDRTVEQAKEILRKLN